MEIYSNEDGTETINSILYKYAGINQYLYSMLINSELWFSNPIDFNDPYDCNIKYNLSGINYDKVLKHLNKLNHRHQHNLSHEHIKNRAKDICNSPQELNDLLDNLLKESINKRGISCFSQSDSKLLMWSHYADSHKGVCLTFDIQKDLDFFRNPYKVSYPDEYPIVDPFKDNERKELKVFLATKSKEWAYEEEIRIIKESNYMPEFRGNIKFSPKALTEIKFGYKTSEEQMRTIKNLVAGKYPHVKLFKSRIKDDQFGIEFLTLN